MRLDRETLRRGLHDAEELFVISDGAEWIRGSCDELFGGRKVTFVLDMFHALEYASDAVKAMVPDTAERDRRFAGIKADFEAGRAAKVIRELEPFSGRSKEVKACCRYYRNNIERMRSLRPIPQPGHPDRIRRCGKWLQAVRAPAETPRHPLVRERGQRHAGAQELHHELQDARFPRLAGKTGRRRMSNQLGLQPIE